MGLFYVYRVFPGRQDCAPLSISFAEQYQCNYPAGYHHNPRAFVEIAVCNVIIGPKRAPVLPYIAYATWFLYKQIGPGAVAWINWVIWVGIRRIGGLVGTSEYNSGILGIYALFFVLVAAFCGACPKACERYNQ